MVTFDVNWFAVIAAAIAGFVVGFAWYSKSLFGTPWAKEMGISDADMKKKMKDGSMNQTMAVNFAATVVTSFVLTNVIAALASGPGLVAAVVVSFWVWLGFILPLLIGSMLWEGKSQKLLTINAGYWLVNLAVMAAVLALLSY